MKYYSVETWANGFGVWHAKASFYTGLGNTPEAERIKHNALANLKRTIRREIQERQGAKVGRLLYEVSANYIDAHNRLWTITVKEKS